MNTFTVDKAGPEVAKAASLTLALLRATKPATGSEMIANAARLGRHRRRRRPGGATGGSPWRRVVPSGEVFWDTGVMRRGRAVPVPRKRDGRLRGDSDLGFQG
jgi:hypothetical protein